MKHRKKGGMFSLFGKSKLPETAVTPENMKGLLEANSEHGSETNSNSNSNSNSTLNRTLNRNSTRNSTLNRNSNHEASLRNAVTIRNTNLAVPENSPINTVPVSSVPDQPPSITVRPDGPSRNNIMKMLTMPEKKPVYTENPMIMTPDAPTIYKPLIQPNQNIPPTIQKLLESSIYRVKYGSYLLDVNVQDKSYIPVKELPNQYSLFHVVGEHGVLSEENARTTSGNDAKKYEEKYQRFDGIIEVNSVSTSPVMVTQLTVLPCLQELKKGDRYGVKYVSSVYSTEQEQEPGYWNPMNHTITHLVSGTATGVGGSKMFNQLWGSDRVISNKISKNGMLIIPNCSPYGFNINGCKKITCSQKWSLYTQYFLNAPGFKNDGVMILTTHHNRMRDRKEEQGILPIKKQEKDEQKKGYANLFMVRISFVKENGNVTFDHQVIQPGFPDKGSHTNPSPDDKYSYIKDANDIDFSWVEQGIREGLAKVEDKKGHILVVRHANSGHNLPTEVKNQNQRLDSILTPLGMTQSLCAGSYGFNCVLKQGNLTHMTLESFLKGKFILPACSFLQRTQHTCMLLLQGAGVSFSNEMLKSLKYLNNQAQIRFLSMNTPFGSFMEYAPLKENPVPYVRSLFNKFVQETMLQNSIKDKKLGIYLNQPTLDSERMNHERKVNPSNPSLFTRKQMGGKKRRRLSRKVRSRN